MCNLYTATKSVAEVAALFRAQVPLPFNTPGDILPGMPGMVARRSRPTHPAIDGVGLSA